MKCAIYVRTSTTEQQPKQQIDDCVEFAKGRGYDIEGIYEEQISGWSSKERPNYEVVKEKARKGEINAVVVWALDRWIRNRDLLLDDVMILRNYGCKLHSVREAWLESINLDGPLGKTIQDFLLGLIGSLGEIESSLKSERVKMAYRSYDGKKWGRPNVRDSVVDKVIELRKAGLSITEIHKRVTYWDGSRNERNISRGAVHKIIKNYSVDLAS